MAAFNPSKLLDILEGSDAGLRFLIIVSICHQHDDPAYLLGRLRACCERPRPPPQRRREYLKNGAASSPIPRLPLDSLPYWGNSHSDKGRKWLTAERKRLRRPALALLFQN